MGGRRVGVGQVWRMQVSSASLTDFWEEKAGLLTFHRGTMALGQMPSSKAGANFLPGLRRRFMRSMAWAVQPTQRLSWKHPSSRGPAGPVLTTGKYLF